jgi:hypothetical protein
MRSLWWKFKCAPVGHVKKDGGLRLFRQFLTLPVGQCQARLAAERGPWQLSSGRAGDWFESYELSSSRFFRDQFDMTAWLARSSSPLGTTTQSEVLRRFPENPRIAPNWWRLCARAWSLRRRNTCWGRQSAAVSLASKNRFPETETTGAGDAVRMVLLFVRWG